MPKAKLWLHYYNLKGLRGQQPPYPTPRLDVSLFVL